MFRLGGLQSRRGTGGGWRTWMLTDTVPRGPLLERHRVHEFLALVGAETVGDPPAPVLSLPDALEPAGVREPRPVALFPGANGESRRWPAGRFSALAQRLATAGRRVLVLGGPGEEGLTEVVASAGAAFGVCEDLGGRTDLAGLADEAPLWITTEKDAVKITPPWAGGADLRVLSIEFAVDEADALLGWLEAYLR